MVLGRRSSPPWVVVKLCWERRSLHGDGGGCHACFMVAVLAWIVTQGVDFTWKEDGGMVMVDLLVALMGEEGGDGCYQRKEKK